MAAQTASSSTESLPSPHSWRAVWSAPSLAGKKIVLAGRVGKWDRERINGHFLPEQAQIVDEVTPDVAFVIVVAAGTNPPPAAKKAEQLNKKSNASIEILSLDDFYKRLAPTPAETVAMLKAGLTGRDRWQHFVNIPEVFSSADASDADFRGLDLSGFQLGLLPLHRADLRGVDLSQATILNATSARFDGANLTEARINGIGHATFVEATGARPIFGYGQGAPASPNADFSRTKFFEAMFITLDLQDSRFVDAALPSATFSRCKLTNADLSNANLKWLVISQTSCDGAVFAGANMEFADGAGQSFQKADFRNANLRGANFFDADLTDAIFDGADVSGANFARAKVTPEQLAKAQGEPAPLRSSVAGPLLQKLGGLLMNLPYPWIRFDAITPNGNRQVMIQLNRQSGKSTSYGVYIYTTGMRSSYYEVLRHIATTLSEVALLAIERLGSSATLKHGSVQINSKEPTVVNAANDAVYELFGLAAPTDAEREAIAAEEKKRQAAEKQRRAAIKKIMLAELRGGASGVQTFNARPLEDFREIDGFAKADLTNAALDQLVVVDGVSFAGAKLCGASLVGANIGRADFKKADFAGATLRDSTFRATFAGASFEKAVLENVDMSGADFDKASFAQAKLERCNFGHAHLRGADLSQATCIDCEWTGARYDELTLLPAGFAHTTEMRWVGQGPPPHEMAAARTSAAASLASAAQAASAANASGAATGVDEVMLRTQRRDDFMQKVKSNVEKAKIDKALKMLKADKFELFVDVADDHLVGVVKSQSDADLVYACRLAADGSYSCCTQNLNVCGGLRGSPCKHLLVLTIGIERSDRMAPETLGLWIASSRNRQTALDKEKMGEVLLRYKGAQVGDIDWRPTETTPEDFYAF